jgi:hypothetical protein
MGFAVTGSTHDIFIYTLEDLTARLQTSRPWFLKLWYAYRCWYTNHCLLVRGLSKNIKT